MSIADLFRKVLSLTSAGELKDKVLEVARRELTRDGDLDGIPDIEEKIDTMFANQPHIVGYVVHALWDLLIEMVGARLPDRPVGPTEPVSPEATKPATEAKPADSLSDFVTDVLGS